MDTNLLINNLRMTSNALSKEAAKPKNYNTDWSYYLDQMSFELHKQANELSCLEDFYGMSLISGE